MTNEERQAAIKWFKDRPVTMSGAKKMYALAVEALEMYVPDTNVGDMISRQAALNMKFSEGYNNDGVVFVPLREVTEWIKALPTVEAIPVEWIEAEIKYLKAANFEFTARAANHIEAMLKKWRGEQEAEHDRS